MDWEKHPAAGGTVFGVGILDIASGLAFHGLGRRPRDQFEKPANESQLSRSADRRFSFFQVVQKS